MSHTSNPTVSVRRRWYRRGWRGSAVYLLAALDEFFGGRWEAVCVWRSRLEMKWDIFPE